MLEPIEVHSLRMNFGKSRSDLDSLLIELENRPASCTWVQTPPGPTLTLLRLHSGVRGELVRVCWQLVIVRDFSKTPFKASSSSVSQLTGAS